MKNLKFDVFIGKALIGLKDNGVIAKVIPHDVIPHGNYNIKNGQAPDGCQYFNSLYALGTYFADWLDLIQNEKLISATIHLNKTSLSKTFRGKDIINIIDKLNTT